MALQFAQGVIDWNSTDAAGTTYNSVNFGFQPKAVIFFTCGLDFPSGGSFNNNEDARISLGFAAGTSDRRCVGFRSVNGAAAGDCQEFYRDDAVVTVIDAAAAVDGRLDLNSFNPTSFTLIVDDQISAGITVYWMAWGGEDIKLAATGEIAEPAATGVQSYSVTGWLPTVLKDSVVFFGGCQLTAAPPTASAQDAGFMFGAATRTGDGNQFVVATNEDNGSASSDTDRYARGDECLAMIAVAGGNPNARASFNGFDSLGFDLSWTTRAVTNRRYIYLAIQGGSWKAGELALDTTTVGNTVTASGLGFTPTGAVIVTHGVAAESTAGSSQTEAVLSVGSWAVEALNFERSFVYTSFTGQGTMLIDVGINHTVCAWPRESSVVQISSNDGSPPNPPNGSFSLIVDTTGGGNAATFLGFVTFGDAPLRPNSGKFPDIIRRGRRVVASGSRPPRSGA